MLKFVQLYVCYKIIDFWFPFQKNQTSSRAQSHRSNNSYSTIVLSPLAASTEQFLQNLFQLLKGLSRALTFKLRNIHLWILLDSYSSTLQKYIEVFIGNPKTMYINLEEILLDLSQSLLRNPKEVNPSMVAIVMSSLLACFHEKEDLVLTKDVRRAIWSLGSNTKLGRNSSSFILRHFVKQALPFERGLDRAHELQPTEFTMDNYHSWWKMDVVSGERARGSGAEENQDNTSQIDPELIVPNTLISIQNAIEHKQVIDGIDGLWEHLLPLVLNLRTTEEDIDSHLIPPKSQWREAFYRFLSVEPTSAEDEDLLVRVLDLISFLLKSMKNSESLKKWVIPLVSEKGSAILRILLQYCTGSKGSTSVVPRGTTLPTIVRSVLDFYHVVVLEGSSSEKLGELMTTFIRIMDTLKQDQFTSPGNAMQYTIDEFQYCKICMISLGSTEKFSKR